MSGFWERHGIAVHLRWGFVALTLLMVGDGIESGFLSPYLDERGFGSGQVSLLWGVYGFVVAIAAWLSGALSEAFGPRRVMLAGVVIWVLFEVAFLVALVQGDFTWMMISFGVRGIGYPLFAFGFLVWVAMDTPEHARGRAVGWYWFFAILGLGVLSSYYAALVIPVIGEFATLASSLAFIVVGGLVLVLLVRVRPGAPAAAGAGVGSMLTAVTIVVENPRVGIGGIVRVINTLGFYAFVVFLATFMVRDVGLTTAQWQTVWGTMLLANVLANFVFGYVADRFGRVPTVAWFGGLACAVSVPAFSYVPALVGPNFWAILLVAVIYGAALSGFVPLSAILPSLAPRHVGSAVAVLNLGAGISQFLGPAVAALVVPIGVTGTLWVISGIYVVGIALTYCLRAPSPPDDAVATAAEPTPEGAAR